MEDTLDALQNIMQMQILALEQIGRGIKALSASMTVGPEKLQNMVQGLQIEVEKIKLLGKTHFKLLEDLACKWQRQEEKLSLDMLILHAPPDWTDSENLKKLNNLTKELNEEKNIVKETLIMANELLKKNMLMNQKLFEILMPSPTTYNAQGILSPPSRSIQTGRFA